MTTSSSVRWSCFSAADPWTCMVLRGIRTDVHFAYDVLPGSLGTMVLVVAWLT